MTKLSRPFSYYAEMAQNLGFRSIPKVWNYLKYRALPRKAVVNPKQYTPQIAHLTLTIRCNLKCSYCCISGLMADRKGNWQKYEATLEKVKRLMETPLLSKALFCDLSGGEPLLVVELPEIIRYLTDQGRLTNVSTNGIYLRDNIQVLKDSGISRVNLSIYDPVRKTLERDLEAVNSIFPIHASYVLTSSEIEENPDAIINWVRFIRDSGCRSLRFWMQRPLGGGLYRDMVYSDNEAYHNLKFAIDQLFPDFCLWPPMTDEYQEKRCPQLWQRLMVNMAGETSLCCGWEKLDGGNIFDGVGIWNSERHVEMRAGLLDNGKPPYVCSFCSLLGDGGV